MCVPLLKKRPRWIKYKVISTSVESSITVKDDSFKFIDSESLLNSSLGKVTSSLPGEASKITKKIN